MDHSLLRSWLGLAPGSWPPDHYALLGLAPGECDPAAVERLVLARMDRLRAHQLRHPELVTEGMNRLAQALVCLTDPVARAAYDAELGVQPNPPTPFPQREGGEDSISPPPSQTAEQAQLDRLREGLGEGFSDDTEPPVGGTTLVLDVRYVPGLAPPEPLPPPYELVEEEPLPPAYEVVSDEEVIARPVAPVPEPPWLPATRRQLYARLARVRRLLVAWRQLQPLLGDPREPLDRPVRVLALLEAADAVRPLLDSLPKLVGGVSRPGGLVAIVLRQPLILATLRTLLPDQRRAVADDWLKAESELVREYARLRELDRSGRPFRRRARSRFRVVRRVVRWVVQTPETIIFLLAATLLIVAVWRRSGGP